MKIMSASTTKSLNILISLHKYRSNFIRKRQTTSLFLIKNLRKKAKKILSIKQSKVNSDCTNLYSKIKQTKCKF